MNRIQIQLAKAIADDIDILKGTILERLQVIATRTGVPFKYIRSLVNLPNKAIKACHIETLVKYYFTTERYSHEQKIF